MMTLDSQLIAMQVLKILGWKAEEYVWRYDGYVLFTDECSKAELIGRLSAVHEVSMAKINRLWKQTKERMPK